MFGFLQRLFRNEPPPSVGGHPTAAAAREHARPAAWLPPIPDGFRIYLHETVAGISFREDEALRFMRGDGQFLELEPEPDNSRDKNAIKVIGVTSRRRFHLGYVPRKTAAQIARSDMFGEIRPRLVRFYADGDFVEVQFQIIGPKDKMDQFTAGSKRPRTKRATETGSAT